MLSLDVGGKVPEPAEDDTEAGDDEDGGEERDEEGELVERPPSGLLQRGQLPGSPLTDVGHLPLEQKVRLGPQGPQVETHLLRGARHDWRDDWQWAVCSVCSVQTESGGAYHYQGGETRTW